MPTDPELASRLLELIAFLEAGDPLDRATTRAGVTPAQAARFLESVKETLAASAPAASPRKKKKARKRARAGSVVAYSDGGSRGNPGKAACAVILCDGDGEELLRRYRLLGTATNNAAEYHGVLLALELAAQLGARDVHLRLDSELVVRQIMGTYKVKHPDLKPFHARAIELSRRFDAFSVEHVRRKDNAEADALLNAALDGKAEAGENAG